jgi:DnaJ like chaperone protein
MQILGKIIGSSLGYIMAGPLGAIIGVIIGNMFDKGLKQHMSQSFTHFHREKREAVINAFIKTSACLMGFFAKADGRVSENELNYANQIFNELKLNEEQTITAKEWFTSSKNGQVSLQDQIRMLEYLKEKNLFLCKNCLDIVYQMIKIDGLNTKKINFLNHILSELGFAPLETMFSQQAFWEQFQQQQQQYYRQNYQHQQNPFQNRASQLDEAFKTLNLSNTATQTEVKKSYRKLMSQFHPDKMMAKGVSQQELKKATEKTQQISKAYELICSVKGWS